MEACNLCQGELEQKEVEVVKRIDSNIIVLNEVPAWVCRQCGVRYFDIKVVEQVEKVLQEIKEEKVKTQKVSARELSFKSVTMI